MLTPKQWFQKQRDNYRLQKAYIERDGYARDLMSNYTKFEKKVKEDPSPILEQFDKDKKLLEYRDKVSGFLNKKNDEIKEQFNVAETSPAVNAGGIGGFLARLGSGRSDFQSNLNKMKLNETDKQNLVSADEKIAAREQRGIEWKTTPQHRVIKQLTSIQENKAAWRRDAENAVGIKNDSGTALGADAIIRLLPAAMKADDLEHNKEVVTTFKSFLYGNGGRETAEKTAGYLRAIVQKYDNIDPSAIDIKNLESIEKNADALSTANFSSMALNDVVKGNPYLCSKLFDSPEQLFEFENKTAYLTSLYCGAQLNHLQEMPPHLIDEYLPAQKRGEQSVSQHFYSLTKGDRYSKFDSYDAFVKYRDVEAGPNGSTLKEYRNETYTKNITKMQQNPMPWENGNDTKTSVSIHDLMQKTDEKTANISARSSTDPVKTNQPVKKGENLTRERANSVTMPKPEPKTRQRSNSLG